MELHSSYGKQALGEESCFLCGIHLDQITDEHVIPKWLQRRFDLWGKRLTLLNATKIQYKDLKIPCCSPCNSKYLSKLEDKIKTATQDGYEAAAKIDDLSWYLWAGKIFYGILRKEFNLLQDRKDPSKGNILPEGVLTSFSNLHLFLQAIRGKLRFSEIPPYSVLICNLHDLGKEQDYFLKDDLINFTIAIRMGEVGVIVSFEDGGLIESSYGRYVREVAGRKLHPIQFDELYAKINYQVSLMDYSLKFLTSTRTDGNDQAITDVFASGSVRTWDQEEFSKYLHVHLYQWLGDSDAHDNLFVPPSHVRTWMVDSKGALLLMEKDEWLSKVE